MSMETWNRLTDPRGRGRGIMVGRRGRTSYRTSVSDPRTRTTGWQLTVGVGGGFDEWRRANGENWDKCNRITIKK